MRLRELPETQSLAAFVRWAWPILEPTTPLVWNWHLDAMCEQVQALIEGRLGKQNLIMNVPPGCLKSTIVSVCTIPWIWILKPGYRGLFLAGSDSIALRDSMKCRELLESENYQSLFRPSWRLAKDQNAKGFFKNDLTGFRMTASAGCRITGERAHGIFVDDPNDAAQDSKVKRDTVNYWWDNAAANRISDPATGTRCLIQQRLNEEDLTGHILNTEPEDWATLVIRQEFEEGDASVAYGDPRSLPGQLMFPDRFTPAIVAAERRRLASAGYAGQHQQRPAPAEGVIFRKGFVQFYRPGSEPKFKRTILSLDSAFKEGQENDFSVCLVVSEAEAGFYIRDRWKERAAYPALREKMGTMGAAWRPTAFLIEDKASGQSLIQDLGKNTTLPVVPVKVSSDKVTRAWNATPTWEAFKIFLPEGATWVDDFLEQLYNFPKMQHDDDVDAFTQAVNWLTSMSSGLTISPEARRRFQ